MSDTLILASAMPIEHEGPITINEALERIIPYSDECIEYDERSQVIRGFTLRSDAQSGYFLTDDQGNDYFTLEDLRKAGVKSVHLKLETYLDTNEAEEEHIRDAT